MQRASHAIELTWTAPSWVWTLVDLKGEVAAHGVAALQISAMETAWRAARSLCDWAPNCFPEIRLNRSTHPAAEQRDGAR